MTVTAANRGADITRAKTGSGISTRSSNLTQDKLKLCPEIKSYVDIPRRHVVARWTVSNKVRLPTTSSDTAWTSITSLRSCECVGGHAGILSYLRCDGVGLILDLVVMLDPSVGTDPRPFIGMLNPCPFFFFFFFF